MTMVMGGVTNMDDEATGQLSIIDLHCIIMAAVKGHDKQHLAYHASTNNYISSLMCSSNLKNHNIKGTTSSPISMQHNIMHSANLTENTISLTNLRSAIHKLQPKD